MTKPSLNSNLAVAVSMKTDSRVFLVGSNLDPGIKKDDVAVTYNVKDAFVSKVPVKQAKVVGSVLVLKMDKIKKSESKTGGDDEITVIVTNPGPPPEESDPIDVPIVFDETID